MNFKSLNVRNRRNFREYSLRDVVQPLDLQMRKTRLREFNTKAVFISNLCTALNFGNTELAPKVEYDAYSLNNFTIENIKTPGMKLIGLG